MGNFDERVRSIVNTEFEEMLEIFQDSVDRTGDLVPKLDRLVKALPLIQDIKTEVASCEKVLKNLKPNQEDEEKEEPKNEDNSNPEQQRQWLEFLKKLFDSSKGLPEPGIPALPGVDLPAIPGSDRKWFNRNIDLLKVVKYLWEQTEDFKKSLFDKLAGSISRGEWNASRQQIDYINKTVNSISSYLTETIKSSVDSIQDAISNVQEALTNCCDDHSQKLDDLSRDLSSLSSSLTSCCEEQSEKLDDMQNDVDHIRRAVDNLDPQVEADKDLALQTRSRAILAELHSLRRLL